MIVLMIDSDGVTQRRHIRPESFDDKRMLKVTIEEVYLPEEKYLVLEMVKKESFCKDVIKRLKGDAA